MKTLVSLSIFCVVLSFLFTSCDKKAEFEYNYYTVDGKPAFDRISPYLNLEQTPASYSVTLPKHLTIQGISARDVNNDKAVLGRVLFWDKSLSKDGKISCGSCHDPNKAFGDDVAFSKGIFDRSTTRNSISLGSVLNFSSVYGSDTFNNFGRQLFFWDNRANSVADQAKSTLANPNEMGMSMADVVDQVNKKEYYLPLFESAFGSLSITETKVLDAISEFINSFGSHDTKFDTEADKNIAKINSIGIYKSSFDGFTASENNGKLIYMNSCANCHGQNFATTNLLVANNGLDISNTDLGVGGITKLSTDMGVFKVPTLRNITKSAPYMHDGRFQTLSEVIDHYSTNIKNNKNLSFLLKNGNTPMKFNFSAQEKADLIAFFNTLEDKTLPTIKRFSDPFKK